MYKVLKYFIYLQGVPPGKLTISTGGSRAKNKKKSHINVGPEKLCFQVIATEKFHPDFSFQH